MESNNHSQRNHLRTLIALALLAAIAFVSTALLRIPVVSFLKYEPKDIVIAIAGFIFGPLPALGMTVVVALIECFTISDTGLWGLLMNVIASASFVLPAAILYKKRRTIGGAVTGLVFGGILAVVMMLLWNLLVTPIYLGYPRSAVADMLLPVFLPFNLLKCSINALLTILLYKPVSRALQASHLVEKSGGTSPGKKRNMIPAITGILLAIVIAATIIFSLLSK